MSEDKIRFITNEGKKIYQKISDELRKKYPGHYYVAIDPRTGEYFVDDDSIKALRKARKKHPRKTFFGAHVGYLQGRI